MTPIEKQIYRFADVEVDTAQGCVKRSQNEVHLRQQTFQVLLYLLERHERLVTREELIAHIWKDTAVTDDALVQCIGEVRKALGDDPRNPRFIKTVPRVGYRFISPVKTHNGNAGVIATEEITTIEFEYEEEHADAVPVRAKVIDVRPTPLLRASNFDAKLWLTSAAVVLLIVIVPSAVYLEKKRQALKTPAAEISLPRIPGKQTLAVMYFDNQSGNAEVDWLREGLADMLITDLSRTPNLTVLGRQQLNSVLERLEYKDGESVSFDTAWEVARRSNADSIVTGSFTRLGERLRIDVQLYDARNGELKAAESLTVEKTEQVLAQTDLLAFKLSTRLGGGSNARAQRSGIAEVMTNNLEAYRYYSLALEKAQGLHNAEAIELLTKAVKLDPDFAMAYARIGYAYTVTSSFGDKAKPYFEKAFQLSERLTEKDRLYISAWYAIANLDYPKAIEALEHLIAQYPLEVEAYERLARLLGGEGRVDEAIEVLKRGLLVDSEAKNIYNVLGGGYSILGRHSEAIAMHERYVQLASNEPNSHDSLGLSQQWAGHYEEAIADYQRALELNPRFEVAVIHRANAYFQQGRFRQAIDEYQRYIEVAPSTFERARGAEAIARVYLRKRNFEQASAWAQRAIHYDPHYVITSFLLALEEHKLSRAERLLPVYTTDWPYATRGARIPQRFSYYLQGSLALKTGRATDAIENFKQAIKQYPPTFELDPFEDCLANNYLELGQLDDAIAEYERILRLNPNYPLLHYHLAQAFERKGESGRAHSEYERFLQVWKDADADIPELMAARKQLSEQS